MQVEGRAWLFGDDMNTDLIYPQEAFRLPIKEAIMLAFSANRPGWSSLVQPGDIVVAGENFGIGSSRAAPGILSRLGIAACVASSFSELFFRNCINTGLPVLACPGAPSLVENEGDTVLVDLAEGVFADVSSGRRMQGVPLPSEVLEILEGGGIITSLERRGLVKTEDEVRAARAARAAVHTER